MPFRDVSPGARGMFEMAAAPVNAFMEGQQNVRRNALVDAQTRRMNQQTDEDEQVAQALRSGDINTAMSLDPDTTRMFLMAKDMERQQREQQRLTGLGEISVTAKPVDEQAIFNRGMKEREFAANQQYRKQQSALQWAQEARLNAPQSAPDSPKFVRLAPAEAEAQGYPKGAVVQRNTQTGEEKVVSRQPPANANIQAKTGAVRTLNYVTNRFVQHLDTVKTGGALGVRGMVSKVTDSQDTMRFDNLREQLSTELRTIFRIPGEGALSDKEQAQYGLQLPDVKYNRKTNLDILADIRERAKLRMMQADEAPADPQTDQVIDFNEYR